MPLKSTSVNELSFKRLRHKLASLPIWISLPLGVMLGLGTLLIFLVCSLVLLFFYQIFVDSWDRSRLEKEMHTAGIALRTFSEAEMSNLPPKIISTSPNGLWTFTAARNQGDHDYHCTLTNSGTNQADQQDRLAEDRCHCLCPTQMTLLWSSDSHYLAVTAITEYSEHVHVINLNGEPSRPLDFETATATVEKLGVAALDHVNHPSNCFSSEIRSKALRWLNNTDLATIVFVKEDGKSSATEIQSAANLTFHFEGDTCHVIARKLAFREDFILDL